MNRIVLILSFLFSLGSDFIGSGDVAFMQKILEYPMTEEIDGEIVDGFFC